MDLEKGTGTEIQMQAAGDSGHAKGGRAWNLRQRFRDKLALWFSAVMLISIGLTVLLSSRVIETLLIQQFGQNLTTLASSGAQRIDGDVFKTLHDPEQMQSPAYLQIRETLL